jgi:hypothetical protein
MRRTEQSVVAVVVALFLSLGTALLTGAHRYKDVRGLDAPGFAEAFGSAAIPARLALERSRWTEAARLELSAAISEDSSAHADHARLLALDQELAARLARIISGASESDADDGQAGPYN